MRQRFGGSAVVFNDERAWFVGRVEYVPFVYGEAGAGVGPGSRLTLGTRRTASRLV